MIPSDINTELCSLTTEETTETPVMTAKEAALYLKVSVKTIYRLSGENKIPHKKIRGQYRFLKSDIERWMKGDSHE